MYDYDVGVIIKLSKTMSMVALRTLCDHRKLPQAMYDYDVGVIIKLIFFMLMVYMTIHIQGKVGVKRRL